MSSQTSTCWGRREEPVSIEESEGQEPEGWRGLPDLQVGHISIARPGGVQVQKLQGPLSA